MILCKKLIFWLLFFVAFYSYGNSSAYYAKAVAFPDYEKIADYFPHFEQVNINSSAYEGFLNKGNNQFLFAQVVFVSASEYDRLSALIEEASNNPDELLSFNDQPLSSVFHQAIMSGKDHALYGNEPVDTSAWMFDNGLSSFASQYKNHPIEYAYIEALKGYDFVGPLGGGGGGGGQLMSAMIKAQESFNQVPIVILQNQVDPLMLDNGLSSFAYQHKNHPIEYDHIEVLKQYDFAGPLGGGGGGGGQFMPAMIKAQESFNQVPVVFIISE